jgi:hypothetical protein
MKRAAILMSLGLLATVVAAPRAIAQAPAISEAEARSIATDAYLYFYPLVTMDLTRKQAINTDPRTGGIGGPPNTFVNLEAYPTADVRVVVRPNFDTLYSSGWIDLTREPMVISVPTRAAATTSSPCSTCGPMYLPRLAGAPQEPRLPISC